MKIGRFLALGAALALLALPAFAQKAAELTRDEVLAKHYEAIGGLDNWKKVGSIKFDAKMTMGPGVEAPATMTLKRPNKIRMEFTFQGMTGVQAFDGTNAWMVMPFMGKTDPEAMTDEQSKNIKEQADLDGPLVDWEADGNKVELVGKEEVEGTETYKLQVTLKNGDVRYHFLDSEVFLQIRQSGKTTIQGQEVEIETTVGDYKEVGGLVIPHSFETSAKGQPQGQTITVTAVEIDPEVADELFVMPEKKAPVAE